jgi:hypothetical protein
LRAIEEEIGEKIAKAIKGKVVIKPARVGDKLRSCDMTSRIGPTPVIGALRALAINNIPKMTRKGRWALLFDINKTPY